MKKRISAKVDIQIGKSETKNMATNSYIKLL